MNGKFLIELVILAGKQHEKNPKKNNNKKAKQTFKQKQSKKKKKHCLHPLTRIHSLYLAGVWPTAIWRLEIEPALFSRM